MKSPESSADIRSAVRFYWKSKTSSLSKNLSGKRADQGKRGGATAGKNMDGFVGLLEKRVAKLACPGLEIHRNKSGVNLPGHFRPSKRWDLVVMFQGRLLATLELKSLGGPSFGNNANNRCEEALGSGLDIQVAQREGRLGAGGSPFVGYFILVEDHEKSRNPPKQAPKSIHFPKYPEFEKASYQERMRILCERMMQERLYTSAAVMVSPAKAKRTGEYADLSAETSFEKLMEKLVAIIKIEAKF